MSAARRPMRPTREYRECGTGVMVYSLGADMECRGGVLGSVLLGLPSQLPQHCAPRQRLRLLPTHASFWGAEETAIGRSSRACVRA